MAAAKENCLTVARLLRTCSLKTGTSWTILTVAGALLFPTIAIPATRSDFHNSSRISLTIASAIVCVSERN